MKNVRLSDEEYRYIWSKLQIPFIPSDIYEKLYKDQELNENQVIEIREIIKLDLLKRGFNSLEEFYKDERVN